MTQEKLKKANYLQETIKQYSSLLESADETYFFCLVSVDCANSNGHAEKCGRIERPVWNRMLDVLRQETNKLQQELDEM